MISPPLTFLWFSPSLCGNIFGSVLYSTCSSSLALFGHMFPNVLWAIIAITTLFNSFSLRANIKLLKFIWLPRYINKVFTFIHLICPRLRAVSLILLLQLLITDSDQMVICVYGNLDQFKCELRHTFEVFPSTRGSPWKADHHRGCAVLDFYLWAHHHHQVRWIRFIRCGPLPSDDDYTTRRPPWARIMYPI